MNNINKVRLILISPFFAGLLLKIFTPANFYHIFFSIIWSGIVVTSAMAFFDYPKEEKEVHYGR